MSDHQYISFEIVSRWAGPSTRISRRWNCKRVDRELFSATLELYCADGIPAEIHMAPENLAGWLEGIIKNACNIAVHAVSQVSERKQVYWWNDEIRELRTKCVGSRRAWTKAKRRRRGLDMVRLEELRCSYRLDRRILKWAIRKAKRNSWQELVDSINRDPWGLPYKLVLNKLRRGGPGLSELLQPKNLDFLLDSLFPSGRELRPKNWNGLAWDENWDVPRGGSGHGD